MSKPRDNFESVTYMIPSLLIIMLVLGTVVASLLGETFELSTNTYFLMVLSTLGIYSERIIKILNQKD